MKLMNNIILPENIEHKQKIHEPEKLEVFYQFMFRFESNESFPSLNL